MNTIKIYSSWAVLLFCFLISVQVSETSQQAVNLWLQYGLAGDKAFNNQNYEKAEAFYLGAIERAASFGLQRQSTDPNISRLIRVYGAMGRYSEIEKKFREELQKAEHQYGADHPELLLDLNLLGLLEISRGRFDHALSLLERSLSISDKNFPKDSTGLAPLLNTMAFLMYAQDESKRADLLFKRSMKLREKSLRQDPLDDALAAVNHAELLHHQAKFDDSSKAYAEAIVMIERDIAPNHIILAVVLEHYANLLHKMNRSSEADKLKAKARALRSASLVHH